MNLLSMNLLLAAETALNAADPDAAANGAANAASAADGAMGSAGGWIVFLIVLAVIFLPFILGNLIARGLKMKELGTRIGLTLFALTLALGPFVSRAVLGQNPFDAINLGIDLAGGANMVFAVDREEAARSDKEITADVMDKMVAAVNRRVNPTGTEEVTVRKVGSDRLEVIVPGADQDRRDQIMRQIVDLGKLEFALIANENEPDHQDIIALADKLPPDQDMVYRNGKLVAKWRSSAIEKETGDPKVVPYGAEHTRTVTRNGKEIRQFLVVVDPDPKRWITGDLLKSVREQVSDKGLAVGFTFNDRGGYLMQQVTSKYQPRPGAGYKNQLAVLLNEEIHSAPSINSPIGSSGQIEGNFSQQEIDELISVLNAGALQVPLYKQPVSEFTVSPLLGIDVQRKGTTAIAIASAVVFVFMLLYYLKAGFIADVCLLLNVVLIMGAMALIDATFTLPGLAGLVLTIGMAVDANVLIFERIREETAKGASTRMAIKNGFEKAFSTIFDANVTTLITAVVLYYIGTDQVKGFAVTLFIGILMSMFSAVFIGRLIFEIAERKRWLKEIKMMSLVNSANFDFLGKEKAAIAVSFLLIAIGLIAVGMRGEDNLDIDFRGGSMVTFKFDGETPTQEEVRKDLEAKFGESISLERLSLEEQDENGAYLFRLRTVETNVEKVEQLIKEAFADKPYHIVQQHVEIGEVKEIPKPETPEEEGESAAVAEADKFAGGHEVSIRVSEAMMPGAVAEEADLALEQLRDNVDVPDDLILARLTEGNATKGNEFIVSFAPSISLEEVNGVLKTFHDKLEGRPHFEELNTFDKSVSGDMQWAAIAAMTFSLVAIVAYLWFRFQRVSFGLAACLALVHDVLITLGAIAIAAYLSGNPVGQLFQLEDFKINLPIVAAFLTIIGYSLNDTIVIFDRIREVRGRNPAMTAQMINQSLNQTLSRTLLTSATTLIVVVILYFIGGEGIHGFAFCLMLGILVGTYSSMFIAAPALMWLTNRGKKQVASA